ncbi:ArnT family glycosyltransferase [Sporolactobacillus pectinivorans]|uniref:ArnT family glycosyltransferase n=1 Tax=Sporolactobacillus pectinivorans TaxID=1591408 RepID=UPI000C2687ED|nr:glycosyltransferase family 39 protein [Sporolactobacillus pectinivorans]
MKRILNQSNLVYLLFTSALLGVTFYNLFYNLGSFPIASFDEARHGVSAYEMLISRNFIVNTYMYKPDYWNLKPPLSFWTIILGYKIAGFNALGLRLVSAVCALLTVITVTLFVLKRHGKVASVVSALVLTTCLQFFTNHCARTGDPDALYLFLFTSAILSLLLSDKNNRWIYVSGLAFALAFLTKSWHAGNIIVIMGLYFFFSGKYKKLSFKNWFILGCCLSVPILVWVVLRYQYDGFTFFKEMIAYDLFKRSTTTIEGHFGGKLYYLNILSHYFIYWLVILYGLILAYANQRIAFKKIISAQKAYWICIAAWASVPLFLFSLAQTKISWYIIPIYPALAIIIGVLSSRFLRSGKLEMRIILLASLLFVSASYEMKIYQYVTHPPINSQLVLIQKLREVKTVRGATLFSYDRTKPWSQDAVLTAELSANLRVSNGNFRDFLNTQRALLFIQKKYDTATFIKTNKLRTVASDTWGYIVSRKAIDPSHHSDQGTALDKLT